MSEQEVLTCVYCGHQYPAGTPPAGNKILTDHIRVCKKHPLRKAEAMIDKLFSALSDLVGAKNKQELQEMEILCRSTRGIDEDKISAINAIHALLATLEYKKEK